MIICSVLICVCIGFIWVLNEKLKNSQKNLEEYRSKFNQSELSCREREVELNLLREQTKQDEDKLKKLLETMRIQFENLSQKIFHEKSSQFKKDSKEQLENTLNPLREQIKNFQDKAEKHYGEGSKEIFSLKNEIKILSERNQQIQQEAQNLTKALKGDVKTQGAWGEFILNQVLEASGLREGEEYILQGKGMNLKSEEGSLLKPDVIVHLPQSRHLVIDAKVSLVHYEQFTHTEDPENQNQLLKSFTTSIRKHISDLSLKKYQHALGLNSLDFVFLFFPLESAFSVALQSDRSITDLAWKESVVIVSPTTLLAALRTVAFMWRRERENKNVLEIARKAGAVYDKFVGFTEDLKGIGEALDKSQRSYEQAHKKLVDGKGNIVSSLESIKKLGARAQKDIPLSLKKDSEHSS